MIALASPILLGFIAVGMIQTADDLGEIRPSKPPLELTRIAALQPKPIVVNVDLGGWLSVLVLVKSV
jgi:hypothetical protein